MAKMLEHLDRKTIALARASAAMLAYDRLVEFFNPVNRMGWGYEEGHEGGYKGEFEALVAEIKDKQLSASIEVARIESEILKEGAS